MNRAPGKWALRMLALLLAFLSWVEVTLAGTATEIGVNAGEQERLIRLRLRNDLSMLPHEFRQLCT